MKTVLFLLLILSMHAFANEEGGVKRQRFDWPGDKANVELSSSSAATLPVEKALEGAGLWNQLVLAQKSLRELLVVQVSAMRSGQGKAMAWFLVLCLLYGMVHAIGPGHGKSVVAGYFLARQGRWMQGLALGFAISMVHALSAVLLLYALYGLASATVFSSFEAGRLGMEKASYALLMLTGALLVVFFLWKPSSGKAHGTPASSKEMLWVALITGMVPCPAVALVVFFCILQGLPWQGLAGATAIGLGMALTNMAFGLTAVALRKGVHTGASRWEKSLPLVHRFLSLLGGTGLVVLGFFLLLSVL